MAETQHPKHQSGHSQSDNLVKPGSTMDPKGGAAAQQGMQNQQDIQNLQKNQQGRGGQQQGQQGGWPQQQLSEQDQKQLQERQQQAWDAAAEREKSNNPATKDQRTYDRNAPGMDPANQPAPDTKLYKATRLDLEDLTDNPGHRGVNPDAPAGSINRRPDDRSGNIESINEPRQVDQNWPQRTKDGVKPSQGPQQPMGHEEVQPQGAVASINEPPGSQVIPPGAGVGTGQERPGVNPDQAPTIEELDPDEAAIGSSDFTLRVHGTNFGPNSVIQFDTSDMQTTYVSDSELTAQIKPSEWVEDGVVPVRVKNADGGMKSEEVEFEFIPAEAPAGRQSKRTQPKIKKRK